MASRGMNMRDMKARSQGKQSKTEGEPKPNTGRRGLEKGRNCMKGSSFERPKDGDEEAELLDELDDAVHVARGDGHFAPTHGRFQRDDDERDCPDEPPPGWGGRE